MELETARQELLQLQKQADRTSDEANAHWEQLDTLEQEKSALEERLETIQELVNELSPELEQTRDQPPTAGLSEDLKPESPEPVANDRAEKEAVEHLRGLLGWSDKEKPSALEDDNQAAEAEAGESTFKPTSFIDQHSHMFDEDLPVKSTGDSPRQSAGPAVPDSSISAGSQEESGDAALEEYMSRLMRRVRGESDSSSTNDEPQLVTPSNESTASDEEASPQESLGLEVQAEVVEPLDLISLKNTSKKPPLPTDMRAMRELANSSARQAITKYSKRRHLETGFSTFLVCGISTGVAAYMMLLAESFQSPLFLGGLILALVGLRWGVKLLGILLDSIREGSRHKSKPTEIPIDEAPLPIDGRAELDSSDD